MKNSLTILFAALLFYVANMQAASWENYSNISQVTDAKQLGSNIWITGKGGVIIYNTTSGEKTYFSKGDAGLPSASIEQIAVNSELGTIWVGTYDNGVSLYQDGIWISYPFPVAMNLYRMKMDGYGNLWMETTAGLYKFDCTSFTYTFINSISGTGWDFNAWDFDITPDNNVLIFTGTNSLLIDGATNALIDSFPNSDSPVVLSCSPTTVRVYEVNANTYLITNGFSMDFEFKDGTYTDATVGLPAFATIGNILRGTDNNLYALVNGNDIYMLDDFTWTFVSNTGAAGYCYKLLYTNGTDYFLNNYAYTNPANLITINDTEINTIAAAQFAFTSNVITSITQNADGKIFIASAGAVYMYNETLNSWEHYSDAPVTYNILYDLTYANGNFYGIDYGNLITWYDGTTWQHIPIADGYSSIYIYNYDVTATGIIYFLNDEGLFKYEDGVTTLLMEATSVFDPFLSLKYDAIRNVIWIGKIDGILKYDFTTAELINFLDVPALADGSSIQKIMMDAGNNVWFGANNSKAYKYDGTAWTDFTMPDNAGEFVVDFAFDGTKTYFGLTDGTGAAFMYDSENDTWTFYSTTEDVTLASNSVNHILLDTDKNLWIAHNDAGVSVLRSETLPEAITENESTDALNMYPNPATSSIQIDKQFANEITVTIYNMQAQVMQQQTQNNSVIDIANLPAGEYIVNITDTNAGTVYRNKLIVQ